MKNIEQIQEMIENVISKTNNEILSDFEGLSPLEMQHLIYHALDSKSPIQLCNNIEDIVLDAIPMFRLAEDFLKIILREKQLKLTPLGALPRKYLVEIYDKKILLEPMVEMGISKVWKEDDCISIRSVKITLENSGLVRKANGKLFLTKKAEKLLATNDRLEIFKIFLRSYVEKFNWGYNDGYPNEPVGQFAWAFTIYMLIKFDKELRDGCFFGEKYVKAFPYFVPYFENNFVSNEENMIRCYTTRTFERFLLWFGLIEPAPDNKWIHFSHNKYMKTDIVEKIFQLHTL